MASPKSGTAGSIVAPTAPTDPADADDAKGGQTTDASNSGSKSGSAPSSVTVKPMATHKPDSDENKDKKSWIELMLVYESNGLPVAGMAYEVTLPDGKTIASGSTDEKGFARVDNIDPGSCQISFPGLDKEAWEDA